MSSRDAQRVSNTFNVYLIGYKVQPLTLVNQISAFVCIPVSEVQRKQLSPWHRVLTGTVGHEPSTRWTVSPDTALDPASVLMEMIQSGALAKVGNAE